MDLDRSDSGEEALLAFGVTSFESESEEAIENCEMKWIKAAFILSYAYFYL